ncbi:FtsX-like permease family protein [Mycoplasmopsis synoviae]|uniref:FtsX-like permease family protein n=1 Tax=Mycoplasmopsis synoviae TaxID=2109 RepID=UPI0034DAFB73
MWNLFKETFLSLFKNKITIIGLTILVFLSTAVFVLLNDASSSIKKEYSRYTKQSKLHDITVDLNIPNSGSAYNDGYYINSLDRNLGGSFYDRPIHYIKSDYKTTSNILDINNIKDEYINLSSFVDDSNYVNKYLAKDDFLRFYNIYDPNSTSALKLQLNFNQPQKTFTLPEDYSFQVYNKVNNAYQVDFNNFVINLNDEIHFDKTYKLSDIATITFDNSKAIVSQLSTLFINVVSKQATFDILKGRQWVEEKSGYRFTMSDLVKFLKLTKTSQNSFIYNLNLANASDVYSNLNSSSETNDIFNAALKDTFTFNLLSSKRLDFKNPTSIIFRKATSYKVPNVIAAQRENIEYFERKHYTTTYDKDNADKWLGSYKIVIDNLKDQNNGEIPKEFSDFSYWYKNVSVYFIRYDNNGRLDEQNKEKVLDFNSFVSLDEVKNTKLSIGPLDDQYPNTFFYNYLLKEPQTIEQIEKFSNITIQQYNNLINPDILSNTFNYIKNQAKKVTQNSIVKYVENKFGKDNLGLRQTVTVESVDNSGNKSVFNFINLGNANNEINGVKLNVDKPFYESQDSTALSTLNNQDLASYFKTRELDPYVVQTLLLNAKHNFSSDRDYIIPEFDYWNVTYTKNTSNTVENLSNVKIYKLANFIGDNPKPNSEYNKFNGYGIFSYGDDFVLVKAVYDDDGKITHWVNADVVPSFNDVVRGGDIERFFRQRNLTLELQYINPNGWVKVDNLFSNIVYLPFYFRAPKPDLIAEALNNNSIEKGMQEIQKALLNTDLYKKGFITTNEIFVLIASATKVANDNNFAKIYAEGNINLNIVPKMVYQLIYELSHNPTGEYVSKILTSFLTTAKQYVNTKEGLAKEIKNLSSIFSIFGFNEILQFLSLDALTKIIENPSKVIDGLLQIVSSIDFRNFADKIKEFLDTEYDKVTTINEIDYTRKFSLYEIGTWLLESIDQKRFKDGVNTIIDSINPSGIIEYVKQIFGPILGNSFGELLNKLDAFKNTDTQYKNLTTGIKELVSLLDFNTLRSSLAEATEIHTFQIENSLIDPITKKPFTKIENFTAGVINNADVVKSLLRALFSVPGSDKTFKDIIIKMLNISSKGQVIQISNDQSLIIPADDPDKLGLFDLINLLGNSQQSFSESKVEEKNGFTYGSDLFSNIITFLILHEKDSVLNFRNLNNTEKFIAANVFRWDSKSRVTQKDIAAEIQKWAKIVKLFEYRPNANRYSKELSLSNLATYSLNFTSTNNNNLFWQTTSNLIRQLVPIAEPTKFNYVKDGYQSMILWWDILFSDEKISYQRKLDFAKDLLKLANEPSVIDSFNSFDLFQPSAENIIQYEKTNFGVSRSIANPERMRELFFTKSGSRYTNIYLQKLADKYPEFREFIENNELLITQEFSYLASSDMYVRQGDDSNLDNQVPLKYKGLRSNLADNFLNGIASNNLIRDNLDVIQYILKVGYSNNIGGINPVFLSLLGISNILIDPVLRYSNPQYLIWALADTSSVNLNQDSVISNLAYFIQNKLVNFYNLINGNSNTLNVLLNNLFKDYPSINPINEYDSYQTIAIDNDFFEKLKEKTDADLENNLFLGINFTDFLLNVINSITSLNAANNVLVFNQNSSYVAKANYAWLQQNNKKIYSGEIPDNPIKMLALLNSLPEDNILNVNGVKFIIIGQEITADYLYPVIDEENLQVDTKSQGIIYVNQNGFDRIRNSYRNNVVKEYVVAKIPGETTDEQKSEIRNNIENYVQETIDDSAKIQRTYLTNELDGINPERSLRVRIIDSIISSINKSLIALTGILIFFVTVSVIFIIKRYIFNKNKVIGILISQGYSPWEIVFSMTTFSIFIIFFGGILGYVVGFTSQAAVIHVIKNYWTLPIVTLNFSWVSLLVTLMIPFLAITVLIYSITISSLRFKSIDLMSGVYEVKLGRVQRIFSSLFKSKKITTKFSASLIFNSFWKLFSFGISIFLTSIVTIFAFTATTVFDKAINETYKNRLYNYKYDLKTPTVESNAYKTFNGSTLDNQLYVPLGHSSEINSYAGDYFRPGFSNSINTNFANGNPEYNDPHVLTQFSLNIRINGGVSVDPFNLIFNSLPDSQKNKIVVTRNIIGKELEKTQDNLVYNSNNEIDISKTSKINKVGFFGYIPDNLVIQNGKFWYFQYNDAKNEYERVQITTGAYRNEYRQFLINGYKKLYEDPKKTQDFLISFGGIYLDNRFDETYTYAQAIFNDNSINLYGYRPDSKQIQVYDNNVNILKKINDEFDANPDLNKPIPLIINEVARYKYLLQRNQIITLKIENTTDRFKEKFDKEINPNRELSDNTYKFKIVDISKTYINTEFIIPHQAANLITKLDKLNFGEDTGPFNGILSKNEIPSLLLSSASLYSYSNFWGVVAAIDTNSMSRIDKVALFNSLFGSKLTNPNDFTEGVLKTNGYSDFEIAKFINPNFNQNDRNAIYDNYHQTINNPDGAINKFLAAYNDMPYVIVASNLDAKNIELSFTTITANTVKVIITFVSIIFFITSIVILIIFSTILINENTKNIAIWSILGYSNKEKVKMFFGIFIPFILVAFLLAIPLAIAIMQIFSITLTYVASIAIPSMINAVNIFATLGVVLGVFSITSVILWINMNKIKAVDLLKGK